MSDDRDRRLLEARLAALREQGEARTERNIGLYMELQARAVDLLEAVRDVPVGGSLPDDVQRRVSELAPVLPEIIARHFSMVTRYLKQLSTTVAEVDLAKPGAAQQAALIADEMAGAAAIAASWSAQLRLGSELARRGLLKG
jgi:hypothetical protein